MPYVLLMMWYDNDARHRYEMTIELASAREIPCMYAMNVNI